MIDDHDNVHDDDDDDDDYEDNLIKLDQVNANGYWKLSFSITWL